MRFLPLLGLLLLLVPSAFADVEKVRASFEAVVRADKTVTVSVPALKSSYPVADDAQRATRRERLKKDWPEFLRRYTEADPKIDSMRHLKSSVFWNEFFKGSSSDDVMRGADQYTASLLSLCKSSKAKVEMEQDPAKRSRMLGRIEAVEKDLNRWLENSVESGRARSALGSSLVILIGPLD